MTELAIVGSAHYERWLDECRPHVGARRPSGVAMSDPPGNMEPASRSSRAGARASGMVVLVSDDARVRRTLVRSLRDRFDVVAYDAGGEAVERVRSGGVAVVLSDVEMPRMSGLELLRAIRSHDADLPVILITGRPTLESATTAIEHGVFRYVQMPFDQDALRETVGNASRLYRLARMKREALELHGPTPGASDRVGLEVTFQRALESLWLAFQPIVSVSGRRLFGYEALLRSSDPALPEPAHLLDAAERLDRIHQLGQLVRLRVAASVAHADPNALIFLNLHPRDLLDSDLTDPGTPLAAIAHRVVLEITERTSLGGLPDLQERVAALRRLGFRIAIDDLGAGYASLTSFALLEPEFVKLDMSLTRGIANSSMKQKLVGSLRGLCKEMHMTVISEGVETAEERSTLVGLGCDLQQGFFFARPGWPIPDVTW